MLIPPKYTLNKKITSFLTDLERLKTKFDLLPQNQIIEKYSRQKSILKSAVYSARIEGNPKTLNEVSLTNIKSSNNKHKIELENLYKSLDFILRESWENDLSVEDIKNIHSIILSGISVQSGVFRQEPSAVFNQAGVAIYVCPPPQEIKKLLKKLINYINLSNETFIPIKAILAHYSFEKIHPFLDGNGRVGRLLVHLILKKWSFDLRGLVAFEEYLEKNRRTYYDLLNLNKKDITPFVEFFLEALRISLNKATSVRKKTEDIKIEDQLHPRRYEILQIIRDHRQISFNFIKRRFFNTPDRLLRYDLKKLQDAGFIIKRGVTKGCAYEPRYK